MNVEKDEENPGARAGAHGAEIVQFKQVGHSSDNPTTTVQQHPAYREGFDAGRQDMLDELVRGRDIPVLLERLGFRGAARLCLFGDAPLDDWSTAFVCDVAERSRLSEKQYAKLASILRYCINFGGFQHDAV